MDNMFECRVALSRVMLNTINPLQQALKNEVWQTECSSSPLQVLPPFYMHFLLSLVDTITDTSASKNSQHKYIVISWCPWLTQQFITGEIDKIQIKLFQWKRNRFSCHCLEMLPNSFCLTFLSNVCTFCASSIKMYSFFHSLTAAYITLPIIVLNL